MPVPRTRPLVALLLLFMFAAPPTRAASEFDGYRIPDHHWSAWSANLSATGTRQHSTEPSDFERTFGQGVFRGNTRLSWGRDSDREQHSLSLNVDALGFRNNTRTLLGSPVTSERTAREQRMTEAVDLFAGGAFYPATLPVGLSLSGGFRSEYDQSWQTVDLVDREPPVERRDAFHGHGHGTNHQSFASLGPVIGRVRDATPVLDARTLEDRLMRTGALARPLSEQGRVRLAGLLAMRGRLKNAHERPERYFWSEVERVFQEDGALVAQGLDAKSVLRITEEVNPRTSPRFVGGSLRVFALLQAARRHSTFSQERTVSLFDHDTLATQSSFALGTDQRARSDFASVGYLAEYHRPIGLHGQLDAWQQLSWLDSEDLLSLTHRLSGYWSVTDRWRAGSEWFYGARSTDRAGSRKFSSWSLGHLASVQYQLEDAWGLVLAWRHNQLHQRLSYFREDSFELGVSYLLSGHFAAPGLVEPMQLEPQTP